MKRGFLIMIIVLITVLISGCYNTTPTDHFIRTYIHSSSNNVTINIFKYPEYRSDVKESTTENITVNVSFYLMPVNAKGNQYYVRDYVRFVGDDKDLFIDISLKNNINNWDRSGANVQAEIYLPKNTNYTINYLNDDTFPDDNNSSISTLLDLDTDF